MPNEKLQQQIAHEAARLLHQRQEGDLHRARLRAARRLVRGWVADDDLPSDDLVRTHLARLDQRPQLPPRPEGAVTHRFWNPAPDDHTEHGEQPAPPANAAAPHLEKPHPGTPSPDSDERFAVFEALLWPLERVRLNPQRHPEGDALFHSLQVFELARAELPYDEEFLLAALLHDVGKGLEPGDHIAAGLAALEGWITPRTAWFIEHHSDANALAEGRLGARAARRLTSHDDYEELKLLSSCDRRGRVPGATVLEVPQALAYLRQLARLCDDQAENE